MRIHFQRFKTLSIKGREMPVEEGPEDLVGRLDELGRGQSRGGLGAPPPLVPVGSLINKLTSLYVYVCVICWTLDK